MTAAYFTASCEQIDALVASHPFAHLVSPSATGLVATPLPLLLERRPDGAGSLLGHFARSNPHLKELAARPEALAIFTGPQGYISPSWLTDRTQAPTWNFAIVRMTVRVRIDWSREAAREAVERLTRYMERDRHDAWRVDEMGVRRNRLLPHVVAFRAEVLDTHAKFKLGQNERPEMLGEMIDGAERAGNLALVAAMRAANRP